MKKYRSAFYSRRLFRAGVRLLPAVVLALIFALAMPARPSDVRAVRSRVSPVYPEIAKRMRIDGTVKVQVKVDSDGKVTDVKAISGNSVLSIAAQEAVRKWRFEPGPSQSTVDVSINFDLAQ